MFIGYTPAIREHLALNQSVQYLLHHHTHPFQYPKLSAQQLCKLILQNNEIIMEDPQKEQKCEQEQQCNRDRRWSSLAQSCDDTYSESVDSELEGRVMAWFGKNNITEGKAENCLNIRLCTRRSEIMHGREHSGSKVCMALKRKNSRFNALLGKLHFSV